MSGSSHISFGKQSAETQGAGNSFRRAVQTPRSANESESTPCLDRVSVWGSGATKNPFILASKSVRASDGTGKEGGSAGTSFRSGSVSNRKSAHGSQPARFPRQNAFRIREEMPDSSSREKWLNPNIQSSPVIDLSENGPKHIFRKLDDLVNFGQYVMISVKSEMQEKEQVITLTNVAFIQRVLKYEEGSTTIIRFHVERNGWGEKTIGYVQTTRRLPKKAPRGWYITFKHGIRSAKWTYKLVDYLPPIAPLFKSYNKNFYIRKTLI